MLNDDTAMEETRLHLSLSDDAIKFKLAALVANRALQFIISECKPGAKVVDLCKKGDTSIGEQMANFNNVTNKGIAFPTCVSRVGHFSPLDNDDTQVSKNDTLKIDLGCHVEGCFAVLVHTHVVQEGQVNGAGADVLTAVNTGAEVALRLIKPCKKGHFDLPGLLGELENCDVTMGRECSSYHSATTVGNKLVFFGGIRHCGPSNDVIIFDTISGRWITPKVFGTPPSPRYGHSSLLLKGGRILIVGGNGILPKDMIWFLEVDTTFVREKRELLGTEVVAWSKGYLGSIPQPIVICGPSGVGKGTLINKLMKDFPAVFGFSVSHTTRLPREKEKSGVHYHFTDREKMELAIQEGKFIESADVHGNLYGTSISSVEAVADLGKRCILDIDVQGAQTVRKSGIDALFIFIAPPSVEELEIRLRGRGTETEEQIQKRMKNARLELEQGRDSNLFDHYVVNDDLDKCYADIKKLIGLDGNEVLSAESGFQEAGELASCSGHSATYIEPYIYIYGGTSWATDNKLTILDPSQIKGGAPGRTTGLRLLAHQKLFS